MVSHKIDQAAFTPSQPSRSPYDPVYLGIKDHIPITQDYLFQIVEELPKKGNPLGSDIRCINRSHPELENFNGNIGHNQPAPVIRKNKICTSIKAASN